MTLTCVQVQRALSVIFDWESAAMRNLPSPKRLSGAGREEQAPVRFHETVDPGSTATWSQGPQERGGRVHETVDPLYKVAGTPSLVGLTGSSPREPEAPPPVRRRARPGSILPSSGLRDGQEPGSSSPAGFAGRSGSEPGFSGLPAGRPVAGRALPRDHVGGALGRSAGQDQNGTGQEGRQGQQAACLTGIAPSVGPASNQAGSSQA